MARSRVIVGIGEALLRPEAHDQPLAGVAATVPRWAGRLGHHGLAVTRLGQDRTADAILQSLRAAHVDVSRVQSDPDHVSARLRERRVGDHCSATIDAEAAFDFLQWDFDLVDAAQEADAVVFGRIGRRRAQSASVIKQFLGECRGALRVFDLTATLGAEPPLDSAASIVAMEFVDAVALDLATLRALMPHALASRSAEAGAGEPAWDQTARELMRLASLRMIILIEPGRGLAVVTPTQTITSEPAPAMQSHPAALVAAIHGIMEGWDPAATVRLATRVAQHAAQHPDRPLPSPWFDSPM